MSKIAIVGPTAVGKTSVAMELSKRVPVEIISADSMQIWRGMDIGTAKPSAEEQSLCKFHLLDVADFTDTFSVVEFQKLALDAVLAIVERKASPVLCGGTGLYVRAVVDRPGFAPVGNQGIRERLRRIYENQGSGVLHRKLADVDPESAKRLDPNDIKRIIRALEVWEVSGRTLTSYIEADQARKMATDWVQFGLACDMGVLSKRIDDRVDLMLQQGLEREVRSLRNNGFRPGMQPYTAMGYQEMSAYMDGRLSYAAAVETIKLNTRRFAKRQRTWFRADKRIKWLDATEVSAEVLAESIENYISHGAMA